MCYYVNVSEGHDKLSVKGGKKCMSDCMLYATLNELCRAFGCVCGEQIYALLQKEHGRRRPSGYDVSDGVLVLQALEDYLGEVSK